MRFDRDGLHMTLLNVQHLEDIEQLQDRVAANLEQVDQLQKLTQDEIRIILHQELFAGVWVNDQLVAARAFLYTPEDDEHLAKDVGIPLDEWKDVIYSEISLVDPSYQGHGLQKQMGAWWMERLQFSPYRYVCATVAPFNIASMKDKFQLGMSIGALKVKYGGKLRYIFVRDFHHTPEVGTVQTVPMADTEAQQRLIASGARGVGIVQQDGEWLVQYNFID